MLNNENSKRVVRPDSITASLKIKVYPEKIDNINKTEFVKSGAGMEIICNPGDPSCLCIPLSESQVSALAKFIRYEFPELEKK